MDNVARIVLGLETHDVAEEVMHYLDRTGRARVVGTATDERQLAEAVSQLEPDAVVASPQLARSVAVDGASLLALDTKESRCVAAFGAACGGHRLLPVAGRTRAARRRRIARAPPVAGDVRAASHRRRRLRTARRGGRDVPRDASRRGVRSRAISSASWSTWIRCSPT